MRISYQSLGRPEMPGWIELRGIGRILVDEESLQQALEYDGQVAWVLEKLSPSDFTSYDFSGVEHYALGDAVPLKELTPDDPVPDERAYPVHYPDKDDDFEPWLREFLLELPVADRILNLPQEKIDALEDAASDYFASLRSGKNLQESKRAVMIALRELLGIISHHAEFGESLAGALGLTGKTNGSRR
jgi:hypothetical protein